MGIHHTCGQLSSSGGPTFVRLQNELELPVRPGGASSVDEPQESSWPAKARRHDEVSQEFDELITEFSKQPGFENFLNARSEGK